ncbi:MAG: hypothetical protein GY884_05705 [Proteobacteria bacterium]|nr:hypothetical protein [Pseudomonadota bacterium]
MAVALLAMVALLYGRAVGFEFVYDDRVLVEGNAALGDLGTLPRALSRDLFHFSETRVSPYWRPTVTLSYYVERALFGAGPAGFHMGNLVFAWLAGFALFLLVRDHHGERAGLVAAGLFIAHPLLVEPVVNIASRTDLVCAALALFALRSRPALGFVLAFLACGAKEPAVLLPVASLVWDRREPRWKALAAGVALYLVLRVAVFASLEPESAGPTLASALGAGERALHLLSRVVFPWGGSPAAQVPSASGALAVVGWLGVGTLVLGLTRTRGLARAGGVFVLGPLLMVAGLLQGEPRFGDGLVLLPLIGVVLIAAPRLGSLPLWIAGPTILLLAGLGQLRIGDWTDEETLWETTHARMPRDPAIRLNLARTIAPEQPERAIALLHEVTFPDARRRGEVHEVRAFARVLTAGDPTADLAVALEGEPSAWTLVTACVWQLPDVCSRAVEVASDDPSVWNAWAIELGPGPDRVAAFGQACELSPDEGPFCANAARSELELAPSREDGLP